MGIIWDISKILYANCTHQGPGAGITLCMVSLLVIWLPERLNLTHKNGKKTYYKQAGYVHGQLLTVSLCFEHRIFSLLKGKIMNIKLTKYLTIYFFFAIVKIKCGQIETQWSKTKCINRKICILISIKLQFMRNSLIKISFLSLLWTLQNVLHWFPIPCQDDVY